MGPKSRPLCSCHSTLWSSSRVLLLGGRGVACLAPLSSLAVREALEADRLGSGVTPDGSMSSPTLGFLVLETGISPRASLAFCEAHGSCDSTVYSCCLSDAPCKGRTFLS